MSRSLRQYVLLAILLTGAVWIQAGNISYLIDLIRHGESVPAEPVALKPGTRTIASGPFAGDQILAIDGRTLVSRNQLLLRVRSSQPGDRITLTLSRPDGSAYEREVVIPDQAMDSESVSDTAVNLALNLVIPLFSIALGFSIAFIRPHDRRAWIVLCFLVGFTETVRNDWFQGGSLQWLALGWGAIWRCVFPIALMYFGIYFPARSARDRRSPWIKYVFLAAFSAIYLGDEAILTLWRYDISLAESFRGILPALENLRSLALLLANFGAFANMRRKSDAETTSDGRRRLRILRAGMGISVGPVILLIAWAVIRRTPVFAGVPAVILVPTLLLMTLLPVTLFYVIVVERAMDLQVVIRTGVKYAMARFGIWVVRSGLIAIAVYLIINLESHVRARGSAGYLPLVGVLFVLLVVRQRSAEQLSLWVDRRFFREAYNSEQVLSELATEVGRYVESRPLIENVAPRLGQTLHVDDIVVLLREGERFHTAFTTRPGEPMDLHESSRIAQELERARLPLTVYFDSPSQWMRELTAEDLQTLDFMRTTLLLPLTGRERLSGIMSLGPKRSEVPWSQTDLRLLRAVAWQMGMALENGRMAASLAEAAALRERVVREMEIAREVQQRLFPQKYPHVAGVDFAGYCRPALGVGGDYYDFVPVAPGRTGLAIGDVSGKGIAAALLMSGLQASLRSQAFAGVSSLADLVSNVSRLIFDASTSSRYATLFYGEFNSETLELRYVNAGHNAPAILRGNECIRLEAGGTVVGLLPKAVWTESSIRLQPGDLFVAFTDGISEALNPAVEEWGEDRFLAAVRGAVALDAAHIIQAVLNAADRFCDGARQADDMTLAVMKLA